MKTIYLVRHGRTRSNEEGRFQGWEDHPLSPVGQEQALSLKKRARDLMVTALYTSDLMRTKETARPLAEEKQLVPQAHFLWGVGRLPDQRLKKNGLEAPADALADTDSSDTLRC